ncbi:hypothetical protein BURC_02770 [Burkholderiaceae bacterium]|nr:hypothetical protein BURC_02770 [Burkholderiaceae bacterium]
MRTLQIPPALEEVLGRSQRPWQLAIVIAAGAVVATALALAAPDAWSHLPWWRRLFAFVLVLDIVAGCLANFTRGTNDYYAASATRRWVFLTVHVHVLVLAWALQQSLLQAGFVWAYTLAGASLVNVLRGRNSQVFVAGAWLTFGLAWIVALLPAPPPLLAVYLLFVLKLVFSFAVDHYGARAASAAAA